MRSFALSLAALALCAGPALAQGEFARPAPAAAPSIQTSGFAPPRPQKPASTTPPIAVRISPSKAAGYLADKVCLPAMFGQGTTAALAPYYKMAGANLTDAGGQGDDKAWYMSSSTKVYVIGFADGACGISSGNGSSGDYRGEVVKALATAPRKFVAGAVKADPVTHLTTTTYCTEGDSPVVARIAAPTLGFHTPHNIEASFFVAKGAAPADCKA